MSNYLLVGTLDDDINIMNRCKYRSDCNNNINNTVDGYQLNDNNTTPHIESIDIDSIFWDSLMDNKIIFFAMIPLFIGYYLQDTVFTRAIAGVTTNIPGFVQDITLTKVLIFMLPYIVALILFYVSNVITSRSTSRIELMTIQNLTDKLIQSIRTSKKPINVNDLILHIKKVGDTKSIYTIMVTFVIPTIIIAIGLLYNFISIDTTYSFLVVIIMIVMILVTIKLEIDSIYYAYNTENSANLIYDEIHEIMTNIDSVITSNTKEEELKQVNEAKEKTYDLACISNLNTNNTTYGLQAISIVAIFGINYLAYRLYVQHLIDDATLTSTVLLSLLFMDYYNYSIQGIKNLINSMGRYNEMREYFQEFKIITQPKAVLDRQITLKVTNGNIIIKNLTVRYENNVIFDNLNLKIKGHSVTGLLGPIGSGKTTILKMLAGIITYKGDILIDDQELENCTYESIVDNIAYISQHPKLFNRTVLYNINYGSALSKDQIMSKLKELGLLQFIDSFKQGLNYVVGKEGSNVSGGQRQFIALIRALIQNKSILLLDEPSSSLDKKNKALFINLIRSIKDKTIIISTHDSLIMPLFNESIDMEKVKSAPHLSRSKSQSHRQKPRIDIL